MLQYYRLSATVLEFYKLASVYYLYYNSMYGLLRSMSSLLNVCLCV